MNIIKLIKKQIKKDFKINVDEKLIQIILYYFVTKVYDDEVKNGDIIEAVGLLSKYMKIK